MSERETESTPPPPPDELQQQAALAWGAQLQEELLTGLAAADPGWTWQRHHFCYPWVLAGAFTHRRGRVFTIDCRWHEEHNICEHADLCVRWRPGFAPPPHPFHSVIVTDPRAEILLFHLRHTLFPRTELEFRAQEAAYREFLGRAQELAAGIADALGERWVGEVSCDRQRDYGIQLTAGNLQVHFDWARANEAPRERYALYGAVDTFLRPHVHGSTYPAITVTSKKTPRQIAGEIQRRLLPALTRLVAQAELARARYQARHAELRQSRELLVEKSAGALAFDERESQQLIQGLRYWPLLSHGERIDVRLTPASTHSPAVALELHLHLETAAAVVELLGSRGFFAPVTTPDPETKP